MAIEYVFTEEQARTLVFARDEIARLESELAQARSELAAVRTSCQQAQNLATESSAEVVRLRMDLAAAQREADAARELLAKAERVAFVLRAETIDNPNGLRRLQPAREALHAYDALVLDEIDAARARAGEEGK